MNPEFAKSMWRGFMCNQNREQADAWYERLTEAEKATLDVSPIAIMAFARKGEETMTPYEQYRAGYITREQWAETIIPEAQAWQDSEEMQESKRKVSTLAVVTFGILVVAYVAIQTTFIVWSAR